MFGNWIWYWYEMCIAYFILHSNKPLLRVLSFFPFVQTSFNLQPFNWFCTQLMPSPSLGLLDIGGVQCIGVVSLIVCWMFLPWVSLLHIDRTTGSTSRWPGFLPDALCMGTLRADKRLGWGAAARCVPRVLGGLCALI